MYVPFREHFSDFNLEVPYDISNLGGADFATDSDTASILTTDFRETAGAKTSYYFPEGKSQNDAWCHLVSVPN
jgi:hypothetical protein